MPKINAEGSPSSYGYEGHVVDGAGAVHEVDPSRNVDGSVVDGYESDERELKDRDVNTGPNVGDEPASTAPDEGSRGGEDVKDEDEDAEKSRREHGTADTVKGQGGEQSSAGTSSPASQTKTGSTRPRK